MRTCLLENACAYENTAAHVSEQCTSHGESTQVGAHSKENERVYLAENTSICMPCKNMGPHVLNGYTYVCVLVISGQRLSQARTCVHS